MAHNRVTEAQYRELLADMVTMNLLMGEVAQTVVEVGYLADVLAQVLVEEPGLSVKGKEQVMLAVIKLELALAKSSRRMKEK